MGSGSHSAVRPGTGLGAGLRAAGVRRLFGMPGGGANLDVIGAAAAEGIPFTLLHGVSLLLVGVVIALLVGAGRSWRGTARERRLAAAMAVVILLLRIGVLVWNSLPGRWSLGRSLPLQICDLAAIGSAFALLTGRRWLWSIAYFWGSPSACRDWCSPTWRRARRRSPSGCSGCTMR